MRVCLLVSCCVGHHSRFINLQSSCDYLGTWYEDSSERDNVGIERRNEQSRPTEKHYSPTHTKGKRPEEEHQTKQILSDTNMNVESLHNLHDLIMEEKEWDDLTNSAVSNFQASRSKGPPDASKDLDVSSSSVTAPRKPTDHASVAGYPPTLGESSTLLTNSQKSDINSSDGSGFPASRDKLKDLLGSSGMSQDLENIRKLAEENARLKSEMSAFDSEFFEELEDLKYRYAKLQEIVGGDPLAPSVYGKSKLSVPLTDEGKETTSKLPLSRMAWSVRNSMRAMDRASEDSPLVQGPRISNAHTYAPGVPSFRGERNQESNVHHHSVAASRRGYESNLALQDDLDDSVFGRKTILTQSQNLPANRLHPYAIPSANSGPILEGGIHGIGSGLYSAQANDQGGNFANLCERRLVFELANQPNPYNATNEFMGKIMELAEKNTTLAKDPAKVGGLYISVPQLKDIIMQSRLLLSPEEVAVLASGKRCS